MKQQITLIHGGTPKENYRDYIDCLEQSEYNPFKDRTKRWRYHLDKDLGEDYEYFMPTMPNKYFADYEEWKIMFEKVISYLRDDVILIGHSMGATFLCKYLDENNFQLKIKKIFLISGAFRDTKNEILGSFNFNKNLAQCKKYENLITFFHSKDDKIVPISDLEEFKKIFPNSQYQIFENRGHFIDETFPEIVEEIKKCR